MKHTDVITQIILMHCPVEEIRKDAKNETDLDWQKMTAIAEDRTNIGETSKRANYVGKGKKNNRGGQSSRQDRQSSNTGSGVPTQL